MPVVPGGSRGGGAAAESRAAGSRCGGARGSSMSAPEPYWADDRVTLHLGDALAVLRELPGGSADCCVTSPPYYNLRDYGIEGQYGLEDSPAEYVAHMRHVFAEVHRVLDDRSEEHTSE